MGAFMGAPPVGMPQPAPQNYGPAFGGPGLASVLGQIGRPTMQAPFALPQPGPPGALPAPPPMQSAPAFMQGPQTNGYASGTMQNIMQALAPYRNHQPMSMGAPSQGQPGQVPGQMPGQMSAGMGGAGIPPGLAAYLQGFQGAAGAAGMPSGLGGLYGPGMSQF